MRVHCGGAAGAPGPNHRRHVMDNRQICARAAEALRHSPIESRAVDGNEDVGLAGLDIGDPRSQRVHVVLRVATTRRPASAMITSPVTSDTTSRGTPASAGERHHQIGAERVARGLAGNEINERPVATHGTVTPITKMPA